MAVPGSGAISLGQIRQELQTANYALGGYSASATGLDPAENGTYGAINTCSPSYPLSANPANMSEWYGYDHDAPCDYSTSSYGFEGGDPQTYSGPTNLLTNVGLDYANNYVLQCDFTQGFSFSMWVRPGLIQEAQQTFNDQYQRLYPLWSVNDYQNAYLATLIYAPVTTGYISNDNTLIFRKSNGVNSGSANYQDWYWDLENGGLGYNGGVTGLSSNENWDGDNSEYNGNQCGFVHLVVVYDPNQTGKGITTLYWNGVALSGSYSSAGNMWSNLNYGNSQCQLAIGNSQWDPGLPRTQTVPNAQVHSWLGHIDWYTHTDQYTWTSDDAKDLYNNGSGSALSNLGSIAGNAVEHFTFGEVQSSGIIEGHLQQAELQVTASFTTERFIRC